MNNKDKQEMQEFIQDRVEQRIHQKIQSIEEMLRSHIQNSTKQHQEMQKSFELLTFKVLPVAEWFENITFLKSSFMWMIGIIGSIVALIIGVKEIMK